MSESKKPNEAPRTPGKHRKLHIESLDGVQRLAPRKQQVPPPASPAKPTSKDKSDK